MAIFGSLFVVVLVAVLLGRRRKARKTAETIAGVLSATTNVRSGRYEVKAFRGWYV